MALQLSSPLLSSYRNASRTAGGTVAVVGFLVLAGWLFDIPTLKSILPGLATMKPNTALAFLLAGSSLWLASPSRQNQRVDLLAKACATSTVLIGLLTLSEHIFSWNLGIDQFLLRDALTPETAHPGRMSLVVALNFSLLGLALLLLARQPYRRLVEIFSIAALVTSTVALSGYAYGVASLYKFSPYSSVAIHTALTFLILSVGILFANPEQGLMRVFSADNFAGSMARRLTPAALVVPFLLGWLFLTGQRMGLYDSTLRLVLSSMSTVIIFAVLILWNVTLLQRDDLLRQQIQAQLNRSEERQATILDTSLDAIITMDHRGQVLEFNPAAQKMFGYTEAEALGREMSQLIIPPSLREQHRKGLANYLATGEGPVLGKRIKIYGMRADGTEFPVELAITRDPGGELPIFTGFVRDITQRERADKTLRESEERFRLVVQAAPSAMIAVNPEGKINLVNLRAQELFGYSEEELLGRSVEMLVPERFRSPHSEYRRTFLAQPTSRPMGAGRDLFGLHKDGYEVPIEIGLTPYESSEGPFTLALIVDITERKRAAEKMAFQAYLLENVNDAVIGSDENSVLTFWNRASEGMFGWKAEEVLGRSGREILRSEFLNTDRQTVLKRLAEQGRWTGESILYCKDGSQVIMEASTIALRSPAGAITGYISVHRDITERKWAEEKIHKQNQRLKVLREIDTAILAADSIENIISAALSHIRELIDCRRANLTLIDWGTNESVIFDVSTINETTIPKGRRFPLVQYQDIIQALSRDQLLLMNDLRGLQDPRPAIQSLIKDGLQSLCSLPLSSQGDLIGMFSVYSDVPDFFDEEKISLGREVANQIAIAITQNNLLNTLRDLNTELEQRVVQRTAALTQANSLLQVMLDNMPDQIYFKDAQSRFIRNSRSQAKALGLSDPAEAVGKSDFDFFSHAQLSFEREQEIIRSGKPLVDLEERVVWPDGQETWVSTTKVPLPDQDGRIIGTFGISRDITERKRAEVALQKTRLELEAANKELEAFSYSVSHDLRAPLRTVDGFSHALLEDYAELLPPEGRNLLERIRASAQYMAALIDDLLNLSKVTRASMKSVPVDLSHLAHDIAAELQRSQPERKVMFRISPNMKARGDPSLLQAVLENLLGNAWKFTGKREQAEIEFGARNDNEETIYFIRDNGAGFDMAYADKLFGAFQRLHAMTEFSGTGIGLATVQRIITRHGGRIWAEAAVDRGATFFFTLPALKPAKPEAELKTEDSLAKRAKEII
jgi:PAS domain S-box-containing protein